MNDIPNLLHNKQASDAESIAGPAMSPTQTKHMSLDDLPPLLTVREVAKILRVSPLTVKRWTKRGRLPAIRINSRGDMRYRKETILYYLGIQQK